MKLLNINKYKTESYSIPHTRGLKKPNEDRLVADGERGIFIILDGVTRPHGEYEAAPFESLAADLGDAFIKEAYAYLKMHIDDQDPEQILRGAVRVGNEGITQYLLGLGSRNWSFYPSTLGIIALLRDGVLHYICVGDCIGVLIRKSSRMLFGREFALEAVDLHDVSKQDRYQIYCNHPDNHLSYTVFNGDGVVMEGLEYSFIDIHEGDTLFLATDGIADYLKFEKASKLKNQTPAEIILASGEYDATPYAEYADDKSLIKLSF